MTPQITAAIPPRNFELVRDHIGGILLAELVNQFTFHNNQALLPTSVDVERFVGADENEFPIIIVCTEGGLYSNKDYGGNVTGEYTYYIDVYTGASSTDTDEGDHIASLNLQRLIGMCQAILDNPIYATLGFDPQATDGMQIQNVTVVDFHINMPKKTVNAADYICGSLKFTVRVPETVPLLPTIAASGANVDVTMDTSGKYYRWIINE